MALLRVEDGLSLARMNLNQICGLAVDSVLYPARRIIECFASGRTEVVEYRAGI